MRLYVMIQTFDVRSLTDRQTDPDKRRVKHRP